MRILRQLALSLLGLLLLGTPALAQTPLSKQSVPNFPVPFGPNNSGRDFWMAFPANWNLPNSTFYYTRLYITSGVKTQVRVFVGGGLFKTVTTIPYDVITVDLSPVQSQVFVRNDRDPVPQDQVYRNKAVHVEGDAPIVVYGMNRTSYTSDGLLALPVNAIGRDYVIASYGAVTDGTIQELPSQYMIVAPYDGTVIMINHPKVTQGHQPNVPFSVSMNKGDVWSAMSLGYNGDLTGATISSTKPVFVAAGQNCAYIPNTIDFCCCDHITETMLPVSSWGNFYHAIPFKRRTKGEIYRIFAAEPNTKVYINGSLYATLTQRGGLSGDGWFEYRTGAADLLEITADKPIYVAEYNPSAQYDGNTTTDPFFYVLTPLEQYQTGVTFSTPSTDFPENYLNFVCDSAAWYEIEIAPGGSNNWKKLYQLYGAVPRFYPTIINNLRWMGTQINIPPGTYRMRSPRPFAGYLYGFGPYDSYGYPLSVAVGDISIPDTIAPTIEKQQNCVGTITATTTDYPDEDPIRSNLATIELDYDTAVTYNYKLAVTPFEAGVNRSTTYTLTVINPLQDAQAILIISDMAGNVTYDTIRYSALKITLSPDSLDLGKIIIGKSGQGTIRITNNGTKPLTFSEARLKDGTMGFTILSPTGAFTIPPGAFVDAVIKFDATQSGVWRDSLGLRDTCGLRYLAVVRAQAVTPIIYVSDKDFGTTIVNSTVPGSIYIENRSTDGGTLTISGGTGPFGTPSMFLTPDGLPQPVPFDLAPGERRLVNVNFRPTAVGVFTDSLVFNHNAPPNPANDSVGLLSGVGVDAAVYATSKDWSYRRVTTGPYDSVVYVINGGNAAATIRGQIATSPRGDVGDFTILNPTDFANKTLNPGESLAVQVRFRPTAVGPRHMEIEYNVDPVQTLPVISKLDGIGTQAALMTDDYDFGQMNVNEFDSTRTVRFWLATTPYPDSLTITNFNFVSDQAGGTPDFRHTAPAGPLTLHPGSNDTISFTGTFRAQAGGLRTASITAVTSDPIDLAASKLQSNWTGRGVVVSSDITGTGDSAVICSSDSALLTLTVTNTSGTDITVDSIVVNGGGVFTLVSPASGGFVLGAGATQQITVLFKPDPQVNNSVTGTVVVYNSSTGSPQLSLPVSGIASTYTLPAAIVMTGTGADGKGQMGADIAAGIDLKTFPPGAVVNSYSVTLRYDATMMKPNINALQVGAANPDAAFTTDQTVPGQITVNATTAAGVVGAGRLFTLPFGVLFVDTLSRSLSGTFSVAGLPCVTTSLDSAIIPIEPICGLHLRLIELTGSKYALDKSTPNPVTTTAAIRYSLGLDGHTRMMLFDANGNPVQTLVNEQQQPGLYELTLDASHLPPGRYYYQMVSGDWKSTTQNLTIQR